MSRKNPGEGSISQRSSGTWQATIQVDGTRKTVYGKTEREVKKKLASLQRQVAVKNSLPTPGRRTVQDLVDEWLSTVGPSLKPRSLANYPYFMRAYVSPVLGHVPPGRITPTHIQRLYTSFLDRGLTRTAAIVPARSTAPSSWPCSGTGYPITPRSG